MCLTLPSIIIYSNKGKYFFQIPQFLISQDFQASRKMLPRQIKRTFMSVIFFSFCPEIPFFARVPGVIVICSEFTDCGKSEQNLASYYYLLVVKLVVKREFLLLRFFFKYFLYAKIWC